jgi:hypothetical protein
MFNKSDRTIDRQSLLRRSVIAVASAAAAALLGSSAQAAKPEIDPTYANGQTVYMIGPKLIEGAATTQPHLYATAEELYLLVYPLNPNGTDTDQKTLPSGYKPQCDPCYHPGLPGTFVYHDHVLVGAPGFGKNGTALDNKGPWRIILLMYNPEVASAPNFTPITDAADLATAEAEGEFLPINQGPGNPFEIETGNVLICPVVSPNA